MKAATTTGLFLFSAFLLLILLPLLQQGTFIDGVLYKTVAVNASEHPAQFWSMKYTDTCMPQFCEQPPLYPWLLGLFYRFFGQHYLVDRLFTLLLLTALFFVLRSICRQALGRSGPWFQLLLFFMLSVQVFCWSYVNQVIEPLVCLLVASGVWLYQRYSLTGRWLYILLFSATLYLSFLSKGFQSCFLVVLPVAAWLFGSHPKRALQMGVAAGFLLALALFVTFRLYQPAMVWFDCYVNARLVLTLNNVGSTTDNHLEIVGRFFSELILPLAAVVVLAVWLRVKKQVPLRVLFRTYFRDPLAPGLLVASLAGSLPFALSLVQRGFYLDPAFLCFNLSLVLGFKRYWVWAFRALSALVKPAIVRYALVVVALAATGWTLTQAREYKREENLLTDLELIYPYLPAGATVSVEDDMWNYFNLHSYLYMKKKCSLVKVSDVHCEILITKKDGDAAPRDYQRLALPTRELQVWVKPADGFYLSSL